MTTRIDGRSLILIVLALAFTIFSAPVPLVAAPPAAPSPAAAPAASGAPREGWYVVEIAGRPVGSFSETRSLREGLIETASALKIVINRMGSLTTIATRSTTEEAPDGRLAETRYEQELSSQPTGFVAHVGDGEITLTSTAGDRSFESRLPFTGRIEGPGSIERLSTAGLRAEGDRIAYQTFAPEVGAVVGVTRELLGVESLESLGEAVRTSKVRETMEGMPVTTTLWLDGTGRVVRTELPGPFGTMRIERRPRSEALRAEGGGELPEESYGATLVRTQLRIPHARRVSAMKIELRHRNPDLDWPDLEGPGQHVLSRDRDRLVLSIERRDPPSGAVRPAARTAANAAWLEPSAYIQSDDPEVMETAERIVGNETDLVAAAKKLERWVAENMQFDMGVVLAPSVEVFRKRRGTCSEYAILLTTLARAAGIPARYVMGYVYVGGIFGGHAWTEVLAGDEWIALDAAVEADGPTDAARFAFQWSSLEDGVGRLNMGPGAQMYGQIDCRVLEYSLDGGPPRHVSAIDKPWSVVGNIFRDNGLGVTLEKPGSLEFEDLDAVWPDDTIVGLGGPSGRSARLRLEHPGPWQRTGEEAMKRLAEKIAGGRRGDIEIGGARALTLETPGRAGLALLDGPDLWLLTVEGDRAPELLREIAGGLRFGAD